MHTAVVGRSFYEQLLPNATVSIGWSAIAVHWLSKIPAATIAAGRVDLSVRDRAVVGG